MNQIVLICDNKYVMPTTIAAMSIVQNANIKDDYCINFICDDVDEKNKKILEALVTKNVEVNIVEVSSKKYVGVEKKYSNVSRASLLKFSIPDLLPEIDKVLYMDGDMLCLRDISEIYNINLEDNIAAVVPDGPKKEIAGGKKHAYYGSKKYFNSGMMLLNLSKMRENNYTKKLIDYRMNEYNYFMDQDAFNYVFKDDVKYLGVECDFMLHLISIANEDFSLEQLSLYYDMKKYDTVDDLFSNIILLHYTSGKPWKYFDVPFNEIWMNYYMKSVFKEKKLNRTSFFLTIYNANSYKAIRKVQNVIRKIVK